MILKWKKELQNNENYQLITFTRFPRWHSGKESACRCRTRKRCPFNSWVGNIPWRKKWQSTPVFLPGKFHGQKSLLGDSPCGLKELDTTEHIHTHSLHENRCQHSKQNFSKLNSIMCKQDNTCQEDILIRVWTWFKIQNQSVQLTILKATKIDHLSIVRNFFFFIKSNIHFW